MESHKTALVTGSTAGIGRAIALVLARGGRSVILTGRRRREEVQELIDRIEELTGRANSCTYVQGDIALEETRGDLVAAAERCGALDVLVNNAGVTTAGRRDILEIGEEDLLRILRVNLIAPFLLTSALAPLLKRSAERSYIINISSISAYAVSVNRADYCMSKAALSMMTQQFAVRLADENIAVFEIRPGIIKTDMTLAVMDKYDALIADGLLPIARPGEGDDVARAVLAIVEGHLPYSTGEILNVDGGFHIRRL